MRILVTGGAGFIGSHIAEHFHETAHVRVLDNLRTGFLRNLDGLDVEFIQGSILDRGLLSQVLEGVDLVFHCAAMVSVPESMSKPGECVESNTLGTLNVLECAAECDVSKLCYCSSAAVYGDNPKVPKREEMIPEPQSPYAVTKLSGEYYCSMFTREGRLPTACLRYFNVFGPRQDPDSQYAAAVPIFISKALKNEDLVIFGDGEQTRDFIYVRDVVAANVHFASSRDLCGVYNIAYGQSLSINDLARRIIESTGSESRIRYAPVRPGDVKHSMAADDRLLETGFRPTNGFEKGLRETIAFFRRES